MNIYLIGMPGCGKSSVGVVLKDLINYSYVDLDKYIEEKNNISIPEIFQEFGEEAFRKMEKEALADFKNKDSFIVSCGGGIISDMDNKKLMNGKVVFIDVEVSILKRRIENDKDNIRPMFNTKTVEELYNERIDKYKAFKDIVVINDDISKCAMSIKEELDILDNVLVLNGPNLNMLGKRPKEHYGSMTLDEISNLMKKSAKGFFDLIFFQSNYEGALVDEIQKAVLSKHIKAIIINPAAYTHTSVAIHDALEMFSGLKVEVHLSHVDDREDFRRINYVRDVCDVCFSGHHEKSYLEAIDYLKKKL